MTMNIADRIKRLRELFGITANDLAKITGIHPVSIRKYETNKMIPGIDVIDKMCDALKLPRMIFEGFPRQHTDYKFTGDFYQQLFLLLDNNTLSADKQGDFNFATGDNNRFLTVNPQLAKYIKIMYGNKEIPLDELHIEIKTDEYEQLKNYNWFIMYLQCLNKIQKAQSDESWNNQSETREEYISRMLEIAERYRFDLMLTDHSWEQYMKGWKSSDNPTNDIETEILNGGDYYSYVDKLDAPETEKDKLIHAYEDAYIEEQLTLEPMPSVKSINKKLEWAQKKIESLDSYKNAHPDYRDLAKEHAKETAENIRKHAAESNQ